ILRHGLLPDRHRILVQVVRPGDDDSRQPSRRLFPPMLPLRLAWRPCSQLPIQVDDGAETQIPWVIFSLCPVCSVSLFSPYRRSRGLSLPSDHFLAPRVWASFPSCHHIYRLCCLSVAYPLPLSCFVLAVLVYFTTSYSLLYLFAYPTYTRRRWRCTK
ncbi:hypothetical protein EV421DRAFT_1992382, partial [Armillaria borealis]